MVKSKNSQAQENRFTHKFHLSLTLRDDFNTSTKFFERLQKTVRDDIRGGPKEESSGKKSKSKTNQLIL